MDKKSCSTLLLHLGSYVITNPQVLLVGVIITLACFTLFLMNRIKKLESSVSKPIQNEPTD